MNRFKYSCSEEFSDDAYIKLENYFFRVYNYSVVITFFDTITNVEYSLEAITTNESIYQFWLMRWNNESYKIDRLRHELNIEKNKLLDELKDMLVIAETNCKEYLTRQLEQRDEYIQFIIRSERIKQ
jgi:hypothetical protein